jgi:aspartyl-tRNA(Asn)/glutamyl-tRNA(Gln) amidotransferase subunit B
VKDGSIKLCSNYITTDLQSIIKSDSNFDTIEKNIHPENFAELISMIKKGEISSNIAKIILAEMYKTQGDPSDIMKKNNLSSITDDSEIETIIKGVVAKNNKAVEDYKNGKENSFMFLLGQIMAESKGKINPQKAKELLKKIL